MSRHSAISEDARKLVHVSFGAGALLLRWLPSFEATMLASFAVCFNIWGLHRLGGASLFRPDERGRRRVKSGIVLYPAAVVGLLLLLPERLDIVAAAWGVLAVGDGMAGLVGRRVPICPIPWNPDKSVGGTLAFIVFGSAAATGLLMWCSGRLMPPAYAWFPLVAGILAAVAAAAVETVPISLDDNVSIASTAAAVMWAISIVNEDLAIRAAVEPVVSLPIALLLNIAVAIAGYFARAVSRSGGVAGTLIGTVILVTTGWNGWALLLLTFGFAVVATRLGSRRKAALGIEEEHGGRRGAGNAIANTGIAAAAALISVLSYAHKPGLLAFAAALIAGSSDTVASEIGKAWGKRTWLVTTRDRVKAGTPGAMSLEGTMAGVAAATLLAALAWALDLVGREAILAIAVGATMGSLLESIIAARFERDGVVNNDVLNFINTAMAAFVAIKVLERM
ncbi:MAG: DUF92 domain-containing protein [Candidatus Limnocylindria bacterium]